MTKYRNVLKVSNVDPIVLRRGPSHRIQHKIARKYWLLLSSLQLYPIATLHLLLYTLSQITLYDSGLYFVLDDRTGRWPPSFFLFSAFKYIFELSNVYNKFTNESIIFAWRSFINQYRWFALFAIAEDILCILLFVDNGALV